MKTAIITGISGQDGAFLAKLLVDKGYRVVGLAQKERESSLHRLEFLQIDLSVNIIRLDLTRAKDINEVLEEFNPDEYYNLAALSSVGASFGQPFEAFDFNTRSVLVALEGIRKVSPKTRFYQASSSEMFGNVRKESLPLKETFLFNPASPYGISKAAAHWLTINYRQAFRLSACCGILFNHESALRPPNFVIKKIIRTAIEIKKGEKSELVVGNTSVVRDWGYAPSYVGAMWSMLQQDKLDDYLICSGNPMSLDEFIRTVFSELELDYKQYVRVDAGLFRSVDLEVIFGDNTKAKKELDWDYNLTTMQLIRQLLQDEITFINWERSVSLAK